MLIFIARLRLLLPQRLPKPQEQTPATSQVVDPSLVGAMHATRTPASLNLLPTKSVWMTCVVSRALHREQLVATSPLDLHPCSVLEATVAAGWVLAVRLLAVRRTLVLLHGLELHLLKPP